MDSTKVPKFSTCRSPLLAKSGMRDNSSGAVLSRRKRSLEDDAGQPLSRSSEAGGPLKLPLSRGTTQEDRQTVPRAQAGAPRVAATVGGSGPPPPSGTHASPGASPAFQAVSRRAPAPRLGSPEEAPMKHRLEIAHGQCNMSIAFIRGTPAPDIKELIVQFFGPLPSDVPGLMDDCGDLVVISGEMPSGKYSLIQAPRSHRRQEITSGCAEEGIGADRGGAWKPDTQALSGRGASELLNEAVLLEMGAEGMQDDPAKAMELYTRAIAKGNATRRVTWDICCISGRMVCK